MMTMSVLRSFVQGATPVKNITPPYPTKIVHLKILRVFDFGL